MSERVGGVTGRKLVDKPWVQMLLAMESFTAKEAGLLARRPDADAMAALRSAKDLRLVSMGLLGDGTRAKRYRLAVKEAKGAKMARTLNEIGAESLACSAEKGFDTVLKLDWSVPGDYYYDPERKGIVPTKLALIHSEVSEALEEFRKGHDLDKFGGELADIIIRVGQLGVGLGIDLDAAVEAKQAANRERPHQHGGRLI